MTNYYTNTKYFNPHGRYDNYNNNFSTPIRKINFNTNRVVDSDDNYNFPEYVDINDDKRDKENYDESPILEGIFFNLNK